MQLLPHSNLIVKAKKSRNWQGVLLACHHQICAVNAAGLNLQSTGPTTAISFTIEIWLCVRFVALLQLSYTEWQFHVKSMSLSRCYFNRNLYLSSVSVSSFRLSFSFRLEDDSVVRQNTLSKFSNSLIWFSTLIPICQRARLLLGLEHVWPVWDTVRVPQKSEDEKRQIGRWRGGTQGPMRSDSRSIV